MSDLLCVNRISRRVFDGDSADAANPALRDFLLDLVGPYRLPLREDLLDAARGHSYGEMAQALMVDLPPLNLLILTHAMPDVIPGRSTATYLGGLCPGQPLAFALCDQGSAAPYTALVVARQYLPPGGSALILVLEQAALHYPAEPRLVPRRHVAMALLLGESGPLRLEPPRQHGGVDPDQLDSLLARELKELDAGTDTTVVLSAPLGRLAGPLPGPSRTVADGQPMTAVWAELAAARTDARLILADYDPDLRYLSLVRAHGQP